MSGFAEYQSTSQWPGGRSALGEILTWEEAQSMLPLVAMIVRDVIDWTKALENTEALLGQLPDTRQMDWAHRAKSYSLKDRQAECRRELRAAYLELETMRLTLMDQDLGVVGFPTLVNNRRAYFVWQVGDTSIKHWCYSCDTTRRQIPKSWIKDATAESTPQAA
ncbi:MAG: DUF2203 family protein [Gemmataceae bacterium]|jgi:hypothetical protein|nr:DUF2203 family protein [Planctomycetota bacterium]